MKKLSLFSAALSASVALCSIAFAQTSTIVNTPATAPLVSGKLPIATSDHTIVDSTVGFGPSGNNICLANSNCTMSGTVDVTGPFQIDDIPQVFPPSGNIVGTSDTQTLTGKSIDAGQLTGTIGTGRLPALTGDVTSSTGSAATTLTQIQGQAITGTQGTGNVLLGTGTNLTTTNFASGVIDPDPTLGADSNSVLSTQAAVKTYVDNNAQGLVYKTPALLATTANITLSGEQTIDGTLTSSSPVLVNNQTDTTQNGIYVSAAGAWSRRADANTGALLKNAAILITAGSTNINTTWNCPCASVTIGSSPIVFVKISGSNVYTGSNGIQLVGNQFSVDSTVARLTTAQTLTNKSISGSANTLTNIPNSALVNPIVPAGSTGNIQTNNGSGALAAIAAPSGTVVGTSDTQTLTNKSISGATNTLSAIPNSALASIACSFLLDAGTSCPANTGASGHTLPFNDGNNTTSGNNTHSGPEAFSDITQAQNLLSVRQNPTGSYQAHCGEAISSEGAPSPGFFIVLTLPINPTPDCTVMLFPHRVFSFYVLPNPIGTTSTVGATYIKTGQFDVDGSMLYIPGSWAHASYILRYAPGGLSWMFNAAPPPPSAIWRINMHNGGVRFDHDPANPKTRLCPDGDGGLIIHRLLFYIPTPCVPLPDSVVSGLGASTYQYIYALRQPDDLVSAVCASQVAGCPCPDTGTVCLTVATTVGFYSGTPITAVNFFGTPWTSPSSVGANVTDDPNTVLVDSTHIELSDVTFVAPETNFGNKVQPFIAYVGLLPDAAQPIVDPIDEVLVNPDLTGKTLVGAVYVDASSAVVDSACERNVASYYNQQPKQLQCKLGATTTTNFTVYHTPVAPLQARFIMFGPTNAQGSVSVPWTISAVMQTTGTTAPTGGIAALFDNVSRGGNSNCATSGTAETPDYQVQSLAQNKSVYFVASGTSSTILSRQENYMSLCALDSDTSNPLNIIGGATPGGTVLTATLMQ